MKNICLRGVLLPIFCFVLSACSQQPIEGLNENVTFYDRYASKLESNIDYMLGGSEGTDIEMIHWITREGDLGECLIDNTPNPSKSIKYEGIVFPGQYYQSGELFQESALNRSELFRHSNASKNSLAHN